MCSYRAVYGTCGLQSNLLVEVLIMEVSAVSRDNARVMCGQIEMVSVEHDVIYG